MPLRKTLAAASFALCMAMTPAASAVDPTSETLTRKLRAVETLTTLSGYLKDVLTPEVGFPQEYVGHWNAAVDAAFAPDLLADDFITALEARLTDEARAAGLAFEEFELGRKIYDLEMDAEPLKQNPDFLAEARQRLDTGSPAENALFVDLFEKLDGPERANAVMDFYFRAMVTAASPVIGTEAAEEWVGTAQDLREGYVEDYFLTTVAVYGVLSDEELTVLAETLGDPAMAEYAAQATLAFEDTLSTVAERLDRVYAANAGGR